MTPAKIILGALGLSQPVLAVRMGETDAGLVNETDAGLTNTCHKGSGDCVWTTAATCGWSASAGECSSTKCYYPKGKAGDLTKLDKKLGVKKNFEDTKATSTFRQEFQSGEMCKRQSKTKSRFDGEKLTLQPAWGECIREFYEVSIENPWCSTCSAGEGKPSTTSPATYTTPATSDQLEQTKSACAVAETVFSAGNSEIVLFVANTPRKAELEAWMESDPNIPKILSNFKLSGTATTVDVLKSKFKVPDSQFIKSDYHTESGPKGGDIQGGALMARGKVRALFFFQSWETECHRCDIQAMVQMCLGLKKSGMKIECAFTPQEATASAAVLAKEKKR